MACHTGGLAIEDLLSAFGRLCQAAIFCQVWTWNRRHRLQIRVHGILTLARYLMKLNVRESLGHRYFSGPPDPGDHHGRSLVRVEQTARLFGITNTVIEQVPVRAVRANIRMATGTALPVLVAEGGIVEGHLPGPDQVGCHGFFQRQPERGTGSVLPHFNHIHAVGKIHGHINEAILDHDGTRPFTFKFYTGLCAIEKTQVIHDLFRCLGLFEPFQHLLEIDHHKFVRAGRIDTEPGIILGDCEPPRIGSPLHGIVQKYGVDISLLNCVKDRHSAGVDPAAVEMGGGHSEPAYGVCHKEVSAVVAQG